MLRLLALGDSYTIGESVQPAERWVEQWAAAMTAAGHAVERPVRVIAQTGWTTDELVDEIARQMPLGPWDLVTLLIGVNNQYRGRDVDDYLGEFTRLLQRTIALANARADRVLVLSIPDWGVTPFARASGRDLQQIADELDACNAAAREVCAAHGVAFVDITGISRDGGDAPAMLAEDGLHPSVAMHARWTGAALPVAKALLATA